MTPVVSILVTVYNRELYLLDTLQSILNSTFQDFELIVVDDGSTDGSLDIARKIAGQDERVSVHVNEANLGDYPNRMKAASLASGRYLKYVDSDDLVYPHSLGVMVDSMERHPGAGLALSHSMPEDESPYPWRLSPVQAYQKHFLERGCLSCGPTGAIIRREAFEAVGGFRPIWTVLSDSDLWFRMAARWPVLLLPPGLVWWRRHEDQEFTLNDASKVYLQQGFELSVETLNNPDCPLPPPDRATALNRSRQHFSRKLLSMAIRDRRVGVALKIFRDSQLKYSDLVKGLQPYE